jgi:hypothetical protein
MNIFLPATPPTPRPHWVGGWGREWKERRWEIFKLSILKIRGNVVSGRSMVRSAHCGIPCSGKYSRSISKMPWPTSPPVVAHSPQHHPTGHIGRVVHAIGNRAGTPTKALLAGTAAKPAVSPDSRLGAFGCRRRLTVRALSLPAPPQLSILAPAITIANWRKC